MRSMPRSHGSGGGAEQACRDFELRARLVGAPFFGVDTGGEQIAASELSVSSVASSNAIALRICVRASADLPSIAATRASDQ